MMTSSIVESSSPQDGSPSSNAKIQHSNLTSLYPTTITYLEDIFNLESISYPEDEAATYEKMKVRLEHASDCFMSWWCNDSSNFSDSDTMLIGFICGTKHSDTFVSHNSMMSHSPEASTVHIHSVVVHPRYRRQGLATKFLKEYISQLRQNDICTRIVLMCKENLISFYQSVGFILKGESSCVHGSEQWFDMYIDL